jgi:GAF domain-containing protein
MIITAPDKKCQFFFKDFPFKRTLSLQYLAEYWQDWTEGDNPEMKEIASTVIKKIDAFPDLIKETEDLSIFEKHEDLLELMLLPIFRKGKRNEEFRFTVAPFNPVAFYGTENMRNIGPVTEKKSHTKLLSNEQIDIEKQMTTMAYMKILEAHYNVNLLENIPYVIRSESPTGMIKYLRMVMDLQFIRVVPIGKIREISSQDIEAIKNDIYDMDLLKKVIPDGSFEFRGFNVLTIVDVSQPTLIQKINKCLLEQNSIIVDSLFAELELNIRSLLNVPDLKLGVIPYNENWDYSDMQNNNIIRSIIPRDFENNKCDEYHYQGSMYEKAMVEERIVMVDDLVGREKNTNIEETFIGIGYRNLVVAPLTYHGKLVGVLELASKIPGSVNSSIKLTLYELLAMFATAVNRSLNEHETNVQAIIQEQCTAIHPTVEWRFFEAAMKVLSNGDEESCGDMEEIVFKNVYPLYALSDIRDSSINRNSSIQNDLAVHLNLAKDALVIANEIKPMPILEELIFRVDNYIEQVNNRLSSGDELSIIEFLRREVESIFPHICDFDQTIAESIKYYFSKLDPRINTVYDKRKEYEDSVALINDTINMYLETEQDKAQVMYPHYFEKYKTDGVEHDIYIGESLVKNSKFDQIYIHNLRLWQLMAVCGIAKKTMEIKKDMIVPLDTAHLILVQTTPLSIRFRYDEKKFDVDGTYNVRYEILKKRIDKASIKGTEERLTQPGKIAIVYSRQEEAFEYQKYISYLQHLGYLTGDVEMIDLEELQGVTGLKALRVTINLKSDSIDQEIKAKDLSKAVRQMIN